MFNAEIIAFSSEGSHKSHYIQFFVPFHAEIIAFSSEGSHKSHYTMSATTKSL